MDFSKIIIVDVLLIFVRHVHSNPAEGINLFDFFMSSTAQKPQSIAFAPDDGKKYRAPFEEKYGRRGSKLIESYGQGMPKSVKRTTTILPALSVKKNLTKVLTKIRRRPVLLTSTTEMSSL